MIACVLESDSFSNAKNFFMRFDGIRTDESVVINGIKFVEQ